MLLSYVPVCFASSAATHVCFASSAATPSLREDIHIGFPKGAPLRGGADTPFFCLQV